MTPSPELPAEQLAPVCGGMDFRESVATAYEFRDLVVQFVVHWDQNEGEKRGMRGEGNHISEPGLLNGGVGVPRWFGGERTLPLCYTGGNYGCDKWSVLWKHLARQVLRQCQQALRILVRVVDIFQHAAPVDDQSQPLTGNIPHHSGQSHC